MRLPGADSKAVGALAAGLLVLFAVVVAGGWLARADRVAAVNDAMFQGPVASLSGGERACQPEIIAEDADRARVWATIADGPVRARAVLRTDDGRALTGPWTTFTSADPALLLPLKRGLTRFIHSRFSEDNPQPPSETSQTLFCVEVEGVGRAEVLGAPTGEEDRLELREGTGAGRMRVEYLYGSGEQPFWSVAGELPGRIAAASGSAWAPWVVGAGLLAAVAGLVALVAGPGRRERSSLRREAAAVAVVALGSGALWAGVTPLFQATDELAHAAYVQAFAEFGHPPTEKADTGEVSEEMSCWTERLRLDRLRFQHSERPPWQRATDDPCAGFDPRKDAALYQGVQPPAYYALASAGYAAADALGRPLPDRLLLARLVSVLLAAVTAVAVFLLVREALPRSPWPARGAALAVGLQPVLMFNHSFVNSDALVFATSAMLAAVLARVWRRGPNVARSAALGALLALGALAKITFLLLVPLVAAVALLVFLRARTVPLRRRLGLLGVAAAVALAPALVYAAFTDAIWEGSVQEETAVKPPVESAGGQMASYVWQAFVPPLPFMADQFPNQRSPLGHVALVGTTSRLGWWNDYGIGAPWSTLIAILAAAVVALGVVTAVRRRRWRLPLAVGAAVSLGFAVLLVAALYVPGTFQVQARYLFVLSPVWGLAVGAAIAGLASRRQGVAVAVLGLAMLVWTGLALGATVSRYYL